MGDLKFFRDWKKLKKIKSEKVEKKNLKIFFYEKVKIASQTEIWIKIFIFFQKIQLISDAFSIVLTSYKLQVQS